MQTQYPEFSTKANLDRVYDQTTRDLAFTATNETDWRAWRERLTAKLIDLLGGFPPDPGPLDPVVLDRVDTGDYVRERIAFTTEPGLRVPAYLLRPYGTSGAQPGPAILCLHGHGRGKDDVAGVVRSPKEAQYKVRALNYDYAHQLARRGYTVLAPDARGFGELALDGMTCTWGMTASLLLGRTLVGSRVWDTVRAVDLLASLPEVDPERIGCVGLSWGGTHTMYAAALDPRIQAAVISGAFGTFKDALIDGPECPCQYVPGLLRHAELPDIVALIAPRPLLIENGDDDPHYTRETIGPAFATVQRAYAVAGAPDNVALDIFPGNHRFHGVQALPWLDRWLRGPNAEDRPVDH